MGKSFCGAQPNPTQPNQGDQWCTHAVTEDWGEVAHDNVCVHDVAQVRLWGIRKVQIPGGICEISCSSHYE